MAHCQHSFRRITAFILCISFSFIILSQTAAIPAQAAYTTTAANESLRAFQDCCYDSNTHLYWGNTDKTGVAAIWTHAIFWNIVLDAYARTGEAKYAALSNDIYQGGYNQYAAYDWDNHQVWFVFDDLMWWIVSMARAYQLTGNTNCLTTAEAGFANVYQRAYDTENGGMFWGFGSDGLGRGHKNSCINYPTIIAAMELYQITGESQYLSTAQTLYAWARIHLFNTATGSVPDLLADTGETDWTNYTYNQGTMIGAAALLYQATNNISYLNDANLAAAYTHNVMCDSNGILPAEGDWNEQGCMKAIFAHYMGILVNECGQTQWLSWMHLNADTAWQNRDTSRNLMYRNYSVICSSGMIQSYEACSGVALLQVFAPDETETKTAVITGAVDAYSDMDYSGVHAELRPGRYTSEALEASSFPQNALTSLRVPAGFVFQIFSEDNFTGTMWEYTSDCSNVGDAANDQMKSCIVYNTNGVTFYQNDLFRGNCITLSKGTYTTSELSALGLPDNWVSSIAIPVGWSIVIYDGDNCTGEHWTFDRGTHNVGSECNDKMSSVAIF